MVGRGFVLIYCEVNIMCPVCGFLKLIKEIWADNIIIVYLKS